jgi:integrase
MTSPFVAKVLAKARWSDGLSHCGFVLSRSSRRRADGCAVALHDLRHTFASVAAASGQSLYVIGSLLGHSQPQMTARYAHLSAGSLRAAIEKRPLKSILASP